MVAEKKPREEGEGQPPKKGIDPNQDLLRGCPFENPVIFEGGVTIPTTIEPAK